MLERGETTTIPVMWAYVNGGHFTLIVICELETGLRSKLRDKCYCLVLEVVPYGNHVSRRPK